MKKVVLIGDSIRLGYQNYVKEALSGVAEVYSPTENCRFTLYVLRNLREWKKKGEWPKDVDVVHWNAGLWDVPRLYGDEPLTPPEFYDNLIRRVDRQIRMHFPKAKVIFATSTAVREEKYGETFKRYNKDIEMFNQVAVSALAETDTVINDLYELTRDIPEACCSDMTHFNTPDGVKLLGSRVVDVICQAAGISEEMLAQASDKPDDIPADILGY